MSTAISIRIRDHAELQIAIDRLRDTSDPVISLDEMRKGFRNEDR